MHLILEPLAQPPVTAWPDTHWCCEWSSYGTHTHFPVSFFIFTVLFLVWNFGRLSWVASPWIFPLFCVLGAPFPCFRFADPKSRFFCLNFCSTLTAYRYAVPSEEMFRNCISSWMYLCRQLRYLSIKCCSVSLIQLCAKGMEKIGELRHVLVPSLP